MSSNVDENEKPRRAKEKEANEAQMQGAQVFSFGVFCRCARNKLATSLFFFCSTKRGFQREQDKHTRGILDFGLGILDWRK